MHKTLLFAFIFTNMIFSQTYKFGKVSKEELVEKFYPLDSTTNAAILYSERKTTFSGADLVEYYYKRVKIYTKEGFDYATIEIPLYHSNRGSESVNSLKAYSYNLVNGQIVKTKLDSKNVYVSKKNSSIWVKRFTMPTVKEGTIIEYKYTFNSPFILRLDEVKLQDYIPIKKLKASMIIPNGFLYHIHKKGSLPITIEGANNTIIKKNIPALIEEPYAGNIHNYKSGVVYELAEIDIGDVQENFSTTWKAVSKEIYKDTRFGYQLKLSNYYKDDLVKCINNKEKEYDKINAIFLFIKNRIKWDGRYGYYTKKGVKKAYKEGIGNVADINLALVSMLRKAGFDANPVLISTINNGIPLYSTITGFNYMIVHVNTSDGYYLLDATNKYSLVNILPQRALNFRGRIIRKDGNSNWVYLYPLIHSLEKASTYVRFIGSGFEGTNRRLLTNNKLFNYRNKVDNLSDESLKNNFEEENPLVEILNISVKNIADLDKNILENIQFKTDSYYEEIGKKVFISPLLYHQKTINPFKSKDRKYPIFFNSPWIENNTIYLSIPPKYHIENLPKAHSIEIKDGLGNFKYAVSQQGQTIIIKSIIQINTSVIKVENYNEIKNFYAEIIKKQAEKIVLAKD